MLWFIHQDDNIIGPLTSEQVLCQLKSGELSYNSHIWARGQFEWNPISSWEDHLQTQIKEFEVNDKRWKLRGLNTQVSENMCSEEPLGWSRRHCLRAPLMGLAKVTRGKQSRFSYVVKTSSIGLGGLGLCGLGSNFASGLSVKIRVESQDLGMPILANGVIKYHTAQGFVGVAFENLNDEAKTQIKEYTRQFETQEASLKAKAS